MQEQVLTEVRGGRRGHGRGGGARPHARPSARQTLDDKTQVHKLIAVVVSAKRKVG